MNTVMIVTGESSGELYGSLLAKALKAKCPEARIIGIGGERMKEAGVKMIAGIASGFGISEAFASYRRIKETFKKAVNAIEEFSPKALVLIDYPEFNIRLAKVAKKKGIKVLYYVSPQVWAWRKGRVKTIAEVSDRIAVILPFEEKIYMGTGVQCEFVGHPVLEEIESMTEDRAGLRKNSGINTDSPVIALLPGSRPHELKSLLPVMIDVVRNFKAEFPDYNCRFIMPVAPNVDIEKYQTYISRLRDEGVVVEKENAVKALSMADMAVIASGTATLQAAFLETPMVVIYKLSPFSYFIGRLIVDVKYISLINLISGREVVKELLQSQADAKNIMRELKEIMLNKDYREQMITRFRTAKEMFKSRRPSMRVAEMACEMTA
ncbi:MAG: lipid-A-disaccharide synthase [Thermodesulfovibrionales bacterium]|nr:lipid-A-disaccharide synthase [Thermodesulfovibrionales bacterium]